MLFAAGFFSYRFREAGRTRQALRKDDESVACSTFVSASQQLLRGLWGPRVETAWTIQRSFVFRQSVTHHYWLTISSLFVPPHPIPRERERKAIKFHLSEVNTGKLDR